MSYGIYRKKPVTVEAIRLTEDNLAEVRDWVFQKGGQSAFFLGQDELTIYNKLEHCWIPVAVGHWLIRGIAGELYPCEDNVFHSTYELVV